MASKIHLENTWRMWLIFLLIYVSYELKVIQRKLSESELCELKWRQFSFLVYFLFVVPIGVSIWWWSTASHRCRISSVEDISINQTHFNVRFFSRKRLMFKFRVWFQPISPLKVKSHTFFLNIMFSWYSLLTFIKARMRRGIWIRKQTFQLFCSTNWRISQKSIWKIWFIWRLTTSIIGIFSWMSFCNTTQTNEFQMGTMGILNSDL